MRGNVANERRIRRRNVDPKMEGFLLGCCYGTFSACHTLTKHSNPFDQPHVQRPLEFQINVGGFALVAYAVGVVYSGISGTGSSDLPLRKSPKPEAHFNWMLNSKSRIPVGKPLQSQPNPFAIQGKDIGLPLNSPV